MWPTANTTYIPDLNLPESPSTPGFEGSVRQEMAVVAEHVVLLTEVFDDLGQPVARSYSFGARVGDIRAMCSAVASDWGMVSFGRHHEGQTPRPVNIYSRITPQRMKLDPVIVDFVATTPATFPRAGSDEGFRVSKETIATIVAGPSIRVPDERSDE